MPSLRTRPAARRVDSPAADFSLLSTRRHASERDRLTLERLGTGLNGARRIFLASAYYDINFCKKLLAHAPRETKEVRLVFNGLGGSRLIAQHDELTKLERALRRRIANVEVRLAFEPGIFHTKLLVIQGLGKQVAFVGSANATMAAMKRNEEILVQVPGDGAMEEYVERIWDASTRLSQLGDRLTARSLISFFRTGSLYFKPTTTLQTTFNPFRELLAALPDGERAKLGAVPLPYADTEAGVGAFNLQRAARLADATWEVEDQKSTKASIKPFSVETCFGYWVPQALDDELQQRLRKGDESKRARLLELRHALEAAGPQRLARRYAEYVSSMRSHLEENGVAFEDYLPEFRRNPFDTGLFRAFFKRVLARLQDDDYIDRLCSPFVQSRMPELWDDPHVSKDFEDSFFDYLEYVAQRPGRQSRVPSTILQRIGLGNSAPNAEQIKDALEEYLDDSGWSDSDW
jgi:hypothetical protein